MNIKTLAVSAALLFAASPALAGPVYIDQLMTGTTSLSTTDLTSLNLSDFGFDQMVSRANASLSLLNSISVPMGGLSLISQEGDTNVASISQTGTYNLGIIQQYGMNNYGSISQSGSNQRALISQNGHNNVAIITQR